MKLKLPPIPEIRVMDVFLPTEAQLPFFECKKPQRILAGGNKSGKSYCGIIEAAYRSLPEYDREGKRTGYLLEPYRRIKIPRQRIQGWISTYSQATQRETLQPTIDQVFKPYITQGPKIEGNTWMEFSTEVADIHFKWQTQGALSYTGANLNWIFMDEPHDRSVYNELIGRTLKTKGDMWICLTPVIDVKDPDYATKMRYIGWMADEIIAKLDSLPNVEVIYVDTESNPHIDIDFFNKQLMAMTPEERRIRKTGQFLIILGQTLFDEEKIRDVIIYMQKHAELTIPDYGRLIYDDKARDEYVVVWDSQDSSQSFPDRPKPKEGWIWKVWEHPIAYDSPYRPEYIIGCDPAQARGGDYACAYVKRKDNGNTVAALHGHIAEENGDLARQLWLGGMYYGGLNEYEEVVPAKLAVEVVNSGKTTISYLVYGHSELGIPKYGLSRMYHRPSKDDMLLGKTLRTDNIGWYTDRSTRPYLLGTMGELFERQYDAMLSKEQLPMPDMGWWKEIQTFILSPQGKYEAASGSYDDRLFASAIADMVIKQTSSRLGLYDERQKVDNSTPFIYTNGNIMINSEFFKKKEETKKRVWI